MTRLFYWLGIFVLTTLVAHLAYVLFLPKYEARALIREMRQRAGVNTFQTLSGAPLRRLVRHPLPDAAYGMCVLELDTQRAVTFQGPDLRALWALTVHSRRGDVIYAITDRHVPPGPVSVRFDYRPPADDGEIALPRLARGTMVVPLQVRRAVLVLEVFPYHPGQRRLVRELVKKMRCREHKIAAPTPAAGTPPASAAPASRTAPLPRARPARAAQ